MNSTVKIIIFLVGRDVLMSRLLLRQAGLLYLVKRLVQG